MPQRRCLGGCGRLITRGSRCGLPDCGAIRNGSTREWRTIRRMVFRRDYWTCQEPGCGHHDPSGRTLHCDHIIARADGGTDGLGNLRTLCATHNLRRGKGRQ